MKIIFSFFLPFLLSACVTGNSTIPQNTTHVAREKLSVLASSFSQESRRNYPIWIGKMESAGYGNAIWRNLKTSSMKVDGLTY